MDWIKTIIIDLIVTAVIIVAVTTDAAWARWAVVIYTPIILVLRLVTLFAGSLTRKFKTTGPEAPAWLYHILYAVNVAALGLAGWWLTAAQWAVIWAMTYYQWRTTASGKPAQSR